MARKESKKPPPRMARGRFACPLCKEQTVVKFPALTRPGEEDWPCCQSCDRKELFPVELRLLAQVSIPEPDGGK